MGNGISLVRDLKRTRKSRKKNKIARKFEIFDSELNDNDLHKCSGSSISIASTKHSYILTDDFDESERLKRKHFVIKCIFEGNFSAPVQGLLTNGCRVLDIGCGPGTWILDMASEYTQSSFIGLDIYHMFPSEIKPNNADFVVANVLNNLPFESNYFNYIHLGDMGYCFTKHEFDYIVVPECVRILKPGGWIEFQEGHRKINNKGPCTEKFMSMERKLMESMNFKSTHYSQNDLIKIPNITNINEEVKQIPLGSWGGKLGEEYQESMFTALFSLAKPIARMYNRSLEEITELINNMKPETSEYKSSHDVGRTFGQREYSENKEIIMK